MRKKIIVSTILNIKIWESSPNIEFLFRQIKMILQIEVGAAKKNNERTNETITNYVVSRFLFAYWVHAESFPKRKGS